LLQEKTKQKTLDFEFLENVHKKHKEDVAKLEKLKHDAQISEKKYAQAIEKLKAVEIELSDKQTKAKQFEAYFTNEHQRLQEIEKNLNSEKLKLEGWEKEVKRKEEGLVQKKEQLDKLEALAKNADKDIETKILQKENKLKHLLEDELRMKDSMSKLWENLKQKQKEEQETKSRLFALKKEMEKEMQKLPMSKAAKKKLEKKLSKALKENKSEDIKEQKVEREVKSEIKEILSEMNILERKINDTHTAFEAQDFESVQRIYNEIRDIYAKLDSDKRAKAYHLIIELKKKLNNQ